MCYFVESNRTTVGAVLVPYSKKVVFNSMGKWNLHVLPVTQTH